jgi:Holliday junction resolvasome RuvABC endonuclease subunit
MKALGAYVRIRQGRYVAGFASLEDAKLTLEQSFPAPADESEAGQLGELYARVGDLLDRTKPDLFALKVSEIARNSSSAVIAHRAEGALLAAVGRHRGLEISLWSGPRLWKPAGFSRSAKTQASVEALCSGLTPKPQADEARQAAAAAVAALAAA